MSKTPSLQQLIQRAESTMANKLGVINPATQALAAMVAGANYGQYAYQDHLFKQLHPETAEEAWLYLWGNRLKTERLGATFATGTVLFTHSGAAVSVPEGTVLATADEKEYKVTAATLSDQPVPVIALDSGQWQNLPAGVAMYLVSSIAGLNPDTITAETIEGGADIEDLESWRDRLVTAFVQGDAVGTLEDYKNWALSSHPDIEFAWALDNTPSVGHVAVYVGQRAADPIVTDTVKDQAQAFLNENRLAGCHITANHPTTLALNIEISGVASGSTRDSIVTTVQNYINDRLGDQQPITPGELVLQITTVTSDFSLDSPISATTPATDEVITLGAVTWT